MMMSDAIHCPLGKARKAVRFAASLRIIWMMAAVLASGMLMMAVAGARQAEARPAQPVAKDARLGGDLKRTRFVADLSKPVNFRVFTLADPYRVVVDLPEVRFNLPGKLGKRGRGLVRAYRYGLYSAGKSRIVIDVKRPVRVVRAFIVEPQEGQPARFVIDLVPTDRKTYMAALGTVFQETRYKQANIPDKTPAKASQDVAQNQTDPGKPIIIIDPGHGGIDSGAVSRKGVEEKKVVLAFAHMLRDVLKASGQFNVKMTRTTDVFVPLRDRVKFARQHRADLMLSIHADSLSRRKKYRWNKVRGSTIYTLSERASDEEAKALAQKENLSDIIAGAELPPEAGSAVTEILIDLAQRETKNRSIALARLLIEDMRKATKLNIRPHRFADLRVLKAPDVPSVLIELGYMTNSKDVNLLTSKAWRKKVAAAMTRAVKKYFERRVAIGP